MPEERMKVKDLKPADYNPRVISAIKLKMLKKSMDEFGDLSGIIRNIQTGNLVGGHQRLKHLDPEWEIIAEPCMDETGTVAMGYIETPHGRLVYREVRWPPEKEIQANIAANNHGGENNDKALVKLFRNMGRDADCELMGYRREIFYQWFLGKSGSRKDDAIPNVGDTARTQPGDLYVLGRHRLFCGDATDSQSIEKTLEGDIPEMCIYDPPYDMDGAWDHCFGAEKLLCFYDYKNAVKAASIVAQKKYAYQFICNCGACWYTPNRPLAQHKGCYYAANSPAWDFDAAVYVDDKKRKAHDVRSPKGLLEYRPLPGGNRHLSTIFMMPANRQDSSHRHSKPVAWLQSILAGSGAKTVFDMFGGSGSALIACENLSIPCYMIELSELQCDLIVKRWETHTGESAVLIPA